jgi:hypothetical protein
MNFKYMPELNWIAGYPFGLAMIALSALIPLVWRLVLGPHSWRSDCQLPRGVDRLGGSDERDCLPNRP